MLRDEQIVSSTSCPECGWVLNAARTLLNPSDRYMTRESVVEELLARLDADIAADHGNCHGESRVRRLLEAYRTNDPY